MPTPPQFPRFAIVLRCLTAACVLLAMLAPVVVPASAATDLPPQRRGVPVTQSRHYTIHSDLDHALTQELGRELDLCHADYAERLGRFAPRAGEATRYDVHLFAHRHGYVNFTGNAVPNSAGAFHSGKQALCAFLEGQGTAELKQTLRHEAFHQFAYERLGPNLPVWANEGLAQVFEYGVRVGDELRMGEVPAGPLVEVQQAVREGRLIDFERMLSFDEPGWAGAMADRDRGGLLYAQAWAMVHFLVYATDDAGTPLYRELFNTFLTDVAANTPGNEAWQRNFGTNVEGFRRRFESYVLTLSPTPLAATLDAQEVLARMLILLDGQGRRFGNVIDFRDYATGRGIVLHRTRNGVTWPSDGDPGAYFRDGRGRDLGAARLRFVRDRLRGPMPVLERRPGDGVIYRTRFYTLAGETRHETLCLPESSR